MTTALHMGSLFAGRYRVLAPLGQGAMGAVYRVLDEHGGHDRALKVMQSGLRAADDFVRFARELRATARLDHPCCIRCFDHGFDGERAYLVMEHVAGGSLQVERWNDPADVVELGLQLLAGLDHIHAQGAVHRDIKPQNIFIDRSGQHLHARLGDLGVVRIADFRDEDVGVADVIGSLRFVAPETLEHGMAEPRSDLYSVGLVLHCLLMGEHPLGHDSIRSREWLSLHRRGQLRPLARSDAPPGLLELVRRLCARRPDDRPALAASAYDWLLQTSRAQSGARGPALPPLARRPYVSPPQFVGRELELAIAQRHCARAREGGPGPCVLLLEGAAGLGKSRLVRELLVESIDHDVQVLASTCAAEGGAPYGPLADLLATLEHGVDESVAPGATVTHAPRGLVGPTAGPDDPTAPRPVVDGSGSEPSEPSFRPPEGLGPEEQAIARLRIHDRLVARLQRLCAQRAVLVVIDDAQWIDSPSLALLSSMIRAVARGRAEHEPWRVGFVLMHRPVLPRSPLHGLRELASALGAVTSVVLGPLPEGPGVAVLASMLRVEPGAVPPEFAAPVLAKAEGNPLFLSQMMRLLTSRGMIGADARGEWVLDAARIATASLPASVSLAIGERAARLATVSKQILAAAAVVGRCFDLDIVARMVEAEELAWLDGLDELVRNELIEDSMGIHCFVHDRIRETIYEAIEGVERRALHLAAAVALRSRDRHRPEAWPTIAHHYACAQEHALAYRFAIMAADRASKDFAHGAAKAYYDLALKAAAASDSIVVDSRVFELYGDACAALGRYAEAVDGYQRGLERSPSSEVVRGVLVRTVALELKRGRYHEAVTAARRVLELAGISAPSSSARARWRMPGQVLLAMLPARRWRGSHEDGEACVRALALAADSTYLQGDHAQAAYYALASANAARALGASPSSVRALGGLGLATTVFGLHRLARHYLELGRTFSRSLELPPEDASYFDFMQVVQLLAQGRTDEILAMFAEMSERYDESNNAEARFMSITPQAHVMIVVGRWAWAQRACDRLRHLAAETLDERAGAVADALEGQLALRRGEPAVGLACLQRAADRSRVCHDRLTLSYVEDARSLFLALHGEHEAALEHGLAGVRCTFDGRLRHYVPIDGGLVVAAALARQRGHVLAAAVTRMVGRVLRWRRWVVRCSRLLQPRFALGWAAWRIACGRGRGRELLALADQAERQGLLGEAWLVHRVGAAFGGDDEPRHRAALSALRERVEQP